MWQENITLDMPYDFDYLIFRLDMDDLNYVNIEERRVCVPLRINQEKHVVKVTAIGSTEHPEFIIEGEHTSRKKELLAMIADIFAWEQDLVVVQDFFEKTDLAGLFQAYSATPLIREFDPFSNLVKTIIHQQLNMAFAQVLTSRFVMKYGEQLDGIWFYPTPETVATIPYQELQELQFSKKKAEYLIDTAKQIVANELDLTSFHDKSDEEVMRQLINIRGIGGAWTAQNWLMFSLGRQDLFPSSDIGIQNALKLYLGLAKKPTAIELEEWNQSWKPYRSYAAMTLWRSIEEP
ncbi:DNA-3-methyladenine glycosylase II [Gracilibacillus boraciitolerans JCM 21714]|uniref:DNA-3-methyladenine glycosylase II n=1 Tax=Gracilibacillus boraciitolerans JCM 21714 TaxID=1298598 RepID=W4VQS4_9BACI|nr:DNA-3-methyladenine glycosylase [Gracilibacillus boraciitolerans]GAE95323.1 DNA-3-methyladenine glycosylase II [Gracilibacillus boraciitolerans JCM 21714]